MSRYLTMALSATTILLTVWGGPAAAQQCKVDNVSCSLSCSVGSGTLNCDGQAKSCSASCSGKDGKDLPTLISDFFDAAKQRAGQSYYGYSYESDISEVTEAVKALKNYVDYNYYSSYDSEYTVLVITKDQYGERSVEAYSEPVDLSYGYGSATVITAAKGALEELRSLYGSYEIENKVSETARNMAYDPGYYYRY